MHPHVVQTRFGCMVQQSQKMQTLPATWMRIHQKYNFGGRSIIQPRALTFLLNDSGRQNTVYNSFSVSVYIRIQSEIHSNIYNVYIIVTLSLYVCRKQRSRKKHFSKFPCMLNIRQSREHKPLKHIFLFNCLR